MSTKDIRTVSFNETIEIGANRYAFGASPSPRDLDRARERAPYLETATHWAVYEDGVAQATSTALTMTENIRGTILPMGGIGGVASLPHGRRKGHVRDMLLTVFAHMREQGQVVSALYPFRDSFYERLGYVEFPKPRFVSLDPAQLGDLVRAQLPGEVTQRDMATAFDDYQAFLETFERARHGFARAHPGFAAEEKASNNRWVAMVKEGDTFTGAMVFRITGYGEELVVDRLLTLTPAARYQLLGWLGRHVDQVKAAIIQLEPDATPELWYRDLVAGSFTEWREAWVAPMGRVIDVAGLSGIGAGSGSVCITLVDDQCPWNTGDWTFTGEGGQLAVTKGGTTQGHVTSQGLAALVWNGIDPAVLPYRGWGDPDETAESALRSLFPRAAPYLAEQF